MRLAILAVSLCLGTITPALAQLSINFSGPGVHIGVNVPVYPTLQRVPGYPVYYAPSLNTNYFFYDGLYWVYEADDWYASSWYNGPWHRVERDYVPAYVLRVPVRYYRHKPAYFRGYAADAPPRWDLHWGSAWQERHHDWDRWNRQSAPAPAPLPTYQRQYSRDRYPRPEQQAVIESRTYRYEPREEVSREHYQQRRKQEWKEKGVPPGHQRSEGHGPPDHAKGKAKGHDKERGKGHDKD